MSNSPTHSTLTRPLAVLDVETTGECPNLDRIVEITLVKFMPGGQRLRWVRRVNPGVPIPPSTTALHHISDRDLASCPTFEAIAGELDQLLHNCDLCGSGIRQVALPFLRAEFSRAGVRFSLRSRAIIDVAHVNHSREPQEQVVLAVAATLDALLAKNADKMLSRSTSKRPEFRVRR
jgi:DNA polymerase III subunit epsilon